MLRLVIEVAAHDADATTGLLFDAGVTGVEQEDLPASSRLIVYGEDPLLARIEVCLAEAARRGLASKRRREPVDDSWQRRWIEAAEAHELTANLVMVPVTEPRPKDARSVLWFEPGWAFGTGGHVTTRLAAEGVAWCLRSRPIARMLDVGTGSGVLALASLVWGARAALGIDCDPRAVRVSERNAELNGMSARATFSDTPLECIREQFDLVVANIDQPTLARLAPDLARVTSSRGNLVVSGLLEEHSEELIETFTRQNMRVVARSERAGWSLLKVRHALGKASQS